MARSLFSRLIRVGLSVTQCSPVVAVSVELVCAGASAGTADSWASLSGALVAFSGSDMMADGGIQEKL